MEAKIERFARTQFAQEITLLRYALIGQGGSQLHILFEAEVDGKKKTYLGPTKLSGPREENPKTFDLEIFKIVDKDLTVSLKFADRIFENAKQEREAAKA